MVWLLNKTPTAGGATIRVNGHILLVDPDRDLQHLLRCNLEREGFSTRSAASAAEALASVRSEPPVLIVLDLDLPDMPGAEVCQLIRADPRLAATSIIILTVRGEECDRISGFEAGADDYVIKANFSIREFILRVHAVQRRGAPLDTIAPDGELRRSYGLSSVDERSQRVFIGDDEVNLTRTEFKLLRTLATHSGRVIRRGTFLQVVWGMPPDLNTRTVDTHVKRLREKLGPAACHLETVRGVGYRFDLTGSSPS